MGRVRPIFHERRRRSRSSSPVVVPRRLIIVGFVVASLLGITVVAATYVTTLIVNNSSVSDEVAHAGLAVGVLSREGEVPGPAMAARLERDFLLHGAHFTTPDRVGPMEASVPVDGGEVMAWTPRRLADEIVAQVAPIRVVVAILFVGTILFVLNRLYRLTIQLEGLRRDAREAADRDALTDAGSRLAFEDGLRQAFANGTPDDLALLYLDLDGFKAVNDGYGHTVGDALLKQVAQRLLLAERPGDIVARLGGDEFAILRPHCGGRREFSEEIAELSRQLQLPYDLGITQLAIRVSIGIALAPGDATTAADLVRAADRALYAVKTDGSRNYGFATDLLPPPAARPRAA